MLYHQEMRGLETALRHIVALDERKRTGQMDAASEQALREAEDLVCSASARKVLQAWRAWRASSIQSFDPTPGYTRLLDESSTRAPAMVKPRQGGLDEHVDENTQRQSARRAMEHELRGPRRGEAQLTDAGHASTAGATAPDQRHAARSQPDASTLMEELGAAQKAAQRAARSGQ